MVSLLHHPPHAPNGIPMHREANWGTRLGLLSIMVYVMPDIRLFVDISHTSIQPLPVVNSSRKVATLIVAAAHPYLNPSLVLIPGRYKIGVLLLDTLI